MYCFNIERSAVEIRINVLYESNETSDITCIYAEVCFVPNRHRTPMPQYTEDDDDVSDNDYAYYPKACDGTLTGNSST